MSLAYKTLDWAKQGETRLKPLIIHLYLDIAFSLNLHFKLVKECTLGKSQVTS